MAIIHKKVWREYFEEIISGKKKLEKGQMFWSPEEVEK